MNNAMVPMQDMLRMAEAIAKSGLFGMKTADQALALMVVAQSEGRHPGSIASEYHIIQGRPALKADAMLARFQQAGGRVEWHDYTDSKVSATFTHPQGGSVKVDWDMARAQAAKLVGKDNWKSYPRAMLRSRVISEGVRTCYPAVCVGVYTVEEVQDFAPEKDITPTAGVLASLPAKTQDVVIETADHVKAYLANDQVSDAYAMWQNSHFDADQEVAFWSLFDSKQRATLKRVQEAERAAEQGKVSPAAVKHLEARIKEQNMDRDSVKALCVARFNKEHFRDLTKEEYAIVDELLNASAQDVATPPGDTPALPPVPAAGAPVNEAQQGNPHSLPEGIPTGKDVEVPAAASPFTDDAEIRALAIENALDIGGSVIRAKFRGVMSKNGWKEYADIPADEFKGAMKFINTEIDKKNAREGATT